MLRLQEDPWDFLSFAPYAFSCHSPGILIDPHMCEVRPVRLDQLTISDARAVDRSTVLSLRVQKGLYAPDVRAALVEVPQLFELIRTSWRGLSTTGRGQWSWSDGEQLHIFLQLSRRLRQDSIRRVWSIDDLAHWLPLNAGGSLAACAVRAIEAVGPSEAVDAILDPLRRQRDDVVVPPVHLRAALPGVLARALTESRGYALADRCAQLERALQHFKAPA